jgi:polar amino acid transport system substrate-binding protein
MVDESVRNRITSLEDLAGKTVGVPSGSVFSQVLAEEFPETTVASYASYSDILAALQRGMIDAYVTDLSTVGEQMDADESLYYLDEALCEEDCGFIMRQDNTALAAEVNEALGELREEGVLDALEEKWFERDGETVTIEHDPDADTSKGTLQVVTSADLQPIAFIQDGEIVGYDIELITRVAEKLGYAVEFTNVAFTGVLTSVVTGKYDIGVGGITVTEERAESVLFSDPVYTTNAVVVSREAATEQTSTLSSLKDSFQRTFITENRWKLIVNGLKVTVEIAVAAMIIGSVLGFFFSIVLRSKRPVLRKLGRGFSTLLGGMPIVIILMIFYYLIFSKSSLSAVVIGIFAFSMDFGNAVAGLLNTGIAAVDPGQLEAAEAMGYNKWQIFYKITFPQAAKQMAGQFNGAVISLVKGTSVVGYITVQDLTKAGDIIRSRTYEAFFPLIAVAVIYFLIAHLIVMIVKRFEVRLDPKRRPRRVRGVTIHD